MKKLVSLGLVFALLFALVACGGTNDGGQGKDPSIEYGRYVEKDITPEGLEGYIQQVFFGDDGYIDLIAINYDIDEDDNWTYSVDRYTSNDAGVTWASGPIDWLEEYIPQDYDEDDLPETIPSFGNLVLMEDGSILAELGHYNTSDYSREMDFYKVTPDGTKEPFDMPGLSGLPEGSESNLYRAYVLPNNRIFLYFFVYQPVVVDGGVVYYGGGMESNEVVGIFDLDTGEMVTEIKDWNGWEIFESDNYLFLQDYSEGYVVIDKQTAQVTRDVQTPSDEIIAKANSGSNFYSGNIQVDGDGNFYLLGDNGLFFLPPGAEEAEQLLNGLHYIFGSPVSSISGFYLAEKDSEGRQEFYVRTGMGGQNDRFLHYTWDDEAPAKSDQSLTVYSLFNSRTVRLALNEYGRMHPEVDLIFEYTFDERGRYYSWDDDSLNLEDVMTQLNTRLLTGDGPDVLILDDLPAQSYIQRGVLEDITSLAGEADFISALVDPLYADDGKLYMVPTRFTLPMLFGAEGYVEQFTTLDALLAEVEARPDYSGFEAPDWENMTEEEMMAWNRRRYESIPREERPALAISYHGDVVEMLFKTSAPYIYSDSTGIDEENLTKLLESAKRITDYYNLASDEDWNGFSGGFGSSSSEGVSYSMSSSLANYVEGKSTLGYTEVGTFYILQEASMMNRRYGSVMFIDGEMVETNPDDIEYEDVNAIIAPGLGGQVYTPILLAGVCSTSDSKELAKDFVQAMLNDDVQLYDLGEGFSVTNKGFYEQYDAYRTRDRYMLENDIKYTEPDFEALFAAGIEPYYQNTYLLDIIQENAYMYLAGELELAQTVDEIMTQTAMYFAERQS